MGETYVKALNYAVEKNCSLPYTFHVFDNSTLPDGVSGWYNKLYLFKRGLLKGKTLFLDLDTVIMGSLDPLLAIDGFAICRDFMYPPTWNSSVMVWDESMPDLWEMWNDLGRPEHNAGDQGIIKMLCDSLDFKPILLQDVVSGIHSYKVDGIQPDSRVVCFHGKPKPHEKGFICL